MKGLHTQTQLIRQLASRVIEDAREYWIGMQQENGEPDEKDTPPTNEQLYTFVQESIQDGVIEELLDSIRDKLTKSFPTRGYLINGERISQTTKGESDEAGKQRICV